MHRPTRTRRLSIAAIVSLVVFALLGGAGVRSLWIWDQWNFKSPRLFRLSNGRVSYWQWTGSQPFPGDDQFEHLSGKADGQTVSTMLKFQMENEEIYPNAAPVRVFALIIPLWFPLLLLLALPCCWLIARPANAPAFPVIAEAAQK